MFTDLCYNEIKKGGAFVVVAFIIGIVVFFISLIFALLYLMGGFFKNIGFGGFGFGGLVFLAWPIFCLTIEFSIYHYAPEAWWVAVLFIIFNSFLIINLSIVMDCSAVFSKNSIYRVSVCFPFLKRYTYDDVVGYVMKKSSGYVRMRKVFTYDVEIFFNDNKTVFLCFGNESDKKVSYIKKILQDNHCKSNGRPRRRYRIRR